MKNRKKLEAGATTLVSAITSAAKQSGVQFEGGPVKIKKPKEQHAPRLLGPPDHPSGSDNKVKTDHRGGPHHTNPPTTNRPGDEQHPHEGSTAVHIRRPSFKGQDASFKRRHTQRTPATRYSAPRNNTYSGGYTIGGN